MFKKLVIVLLVITGLGYLLWPQIAPRLSPWLEILESKPVSASSSEDHAQPDPPVTPTPHPAEIDLALFPDPDAVGWASNLDGHSHLAEPEIYVGSFEGHIFLGALQFDLSAVPPGAVVTYANLQLAGFDTENIGSDGKWQLHLLDPAVDANWRTLLNYDALRQAVSQVSIGSALTSSDLNQGQVNSFRFGAEQLVALQSHLANGVVSFRLDGPTEEKNNLFTWIGDDGSKTLAKNRPALHLRYMLALNADDGAIAAPIPVETVDAPPVSQEETQPNTPTPTTDAPAVAPLSPAEMVIVTSTPQPENIITVAALAAEATEIAATAGASTPVPRNWVTPIIVTAQPTPANTATAEFLEAAATAEAFLKGAATPTPPNLWTATPVLPTPTSTATPSPTPLVPVLVTNTPTPENIVTVAAQAATATAVATAVGTYTPVPRNWVVPVVVTPQPPQPTPANAATAAFQMAEATAQAFLNGAASSPTYIWTATPTPFIMPVVGEVATPWVAPSPTPTPRLIPEQLVGKIAFLSNRSGGAEPLRKPLVYVVDPEGSNLSVLTDYTFYDLAMARDVYSADQRYRTFVKDFPRYFGSDGKFDLVPAIFFYDYFYNVEEQITFFGAGKAWDPVWSPTREQIAFVSNDSKDDEIWIVNRDGSGIQRLTETNEAFNAREIGKDTFIPEVNGHPSWSPDGTQIVFWSNRTGHRQIWIMNVDGSNLYSLSTTGYDDWNPVWIKYIDPARNPSPEIGIDTR